jgi:hypothetical protein
MRKVISSVSTAVSSIVAAIDEVVIASGDYISMSARTRMEKIDPDQALPN